MEDNIISKWIFKYGNEIVRKNTEEKLRKLMKNIHVLKTDKPSRLFIDVDDNKLKITVPIGGEHMINQNIYITSDEEIKEGDWVKLFVKHIDKEWIHKITKEDLLLYTDFNNEGAKIILTTDQDLIKDGVQAIDDEFLEWFIKNPSCEIAETVKVPYHDESGYSYLLGIPKEEPTCWDCKGAISKEGICFCNREGEEPKQEYEYESECICDGECREFVNVKCKKLKQQETIEEIYLNKLIDEANKEWSLDRKLAKEVALKFAKWQQERRYSEKEIGLLNKIFEIYWYENNSQHPDNLEEWELSKKIIEQFKKK